MQLRDRKTAITAALFANSNWDGDENSTRRDDAIAGLEQQFDEATAKIYGEEQEEERIDWEDPFFKHSGKVRSSKEELEAELGRQSQNELLQQSLAQIDQS